MTALYCAQGGATRSCHRNSLILLTLLDAALARAVQRLGRDGSWALPSLMIDCTPNRVTLVRVVAGFAAVCLFGRGPWLNLAALAFTVASIALDALDGHIARRRHLATPVGAQIDILGDRMIENVYFTYFAVIGMVSLWLPVFFFARGAATDFLRSLATRAGHSGGCANAVLNTGWGRRLVASRWSRGLYAAMKCLCFCYLGLELALTRGPVALLGQLTADLQATIRTGALVLTSATAAFCFLRGLPVLLEGWRYMAGSLMASPRAKISAGKIA